MDFNIGDIVRAKDGAPYSITTDGWTGRVTENHGYYIVVEGRDGSFSVDPDFFVLVHEKKEETKMDVSEIITEEERYALLNDMEQLLSEYDYKFTGYALNKIIDTWATNKADLIKAFKRHPNYLEGKFMIVFSHDFNRKIDMRALCDFFNWVMYTAAEPVREFMPTEMKDYVSSHCCKYPDNVFNMF